MKGFELKCNLQHQPARVGEQKIHTGKTWGDLPAELIRRVCTEDGLGKRIWLKLRQINRHWRLSICDQVEKIAIPSHSQPPLSSLVQNLMTNYPRLTALRLEKLPHKEVPHMTRLTKLKSLDLCRTNATDQSVHHLCQLSSLTSLGVAGARLEDDGLACITKNLTNLSDLNIRGTRVSDKGIAFLTALKNLQSLDLRNTRVLTLGGGALQKVSTLTMLKVAKTHVTQGALADLTQDVPACEVIR